MSFIEIPVSSSILTAYNTPVNKGLLYNRGTELSPNWLFHLQFNPSGGSKEKDFEKTIHKGINVTYLEIVQNLPVIQIETQDGRKAIEDIFLTIESETSGAAFEVHDYSWVKPSDVSQGYTIRNMVLMSIESLGGLFNTSSNGFLGLGWRIQLQGVDYDTN